MAANAQKLRKLKADSRRAVLGNLSGTFVYFSAPDEADEKYEPLHGKLLLVTSDFEWQDHKHYITGLIINEPANMEIVQEFRKAAQHTRFHFTTLLNSSQTGFSYEHAFTFLTPKEGSPDLPNRVTFDGCAMYQCYSKEEINFMADLLKDRTEVLAAYSEVIMKRGEIVPLIEDGYAFVRPASPDMIFKGGPLERTFRAFPELNPGIPF